jgi:hypothetical protein
MKNMKPEYHEGPKAGENFKKLAGAPGLASETRESKNTNPTTTS